MKRIKIKNLPKDFDLCGSVLCIPKEVRAKQPELLSKMFIKSGWNKGIWCMKKKAQNGRIYPVFFENFNECGEWEIETNDIRALVKKE
jgi:hypothetical protein